MPIYDFNVKTLSDEDLTTLFNAYNQATTIFSAILNMPRADSDGVEEALTHEITRIDHLCDQLTQEVKRRMAIGKNNKSECLSFMLSRCKTVTVEEEFHLLQSLISNQEKW